MKLITFSLEIVNHNRYSVQKLDKDVEISRRLNKSTTEQATLFDLPKIRKPKKIVSVDLLERKSYPPKVVDEGYFQLQNRRYLGNKFRLLGFIKGIVSQKCEQIESFCDIFAGTGVVGESHNSSKVKVISNDFLVSNFLALRVFLELQEHPCKEVTKKIEHLNNLPCSNENYFSHHFGGKYFSVENAKKIGTIREEIDKITVSSMEKAILICSLIYAVDKVANTVGHYDAYRKKLDMTQPVKMLVPDVRYQNNKNNQTFCEDANSLIKRVYSDVLYIDPPYNSRQYSDAYHLLENLAEWKKPELVGIGKKMDRSHIKSDYCLKNALQAFADLIMNANCRHILLSYNNTGDSMDQRSNSRMTDLEIVDILKMRGKVELFEQSYKPFAAGKSTIKHHTERIFYCKVRKP